MELTPEAEARVRDAVARATADVAALRHLRKAEVTRAVERLASAWEDMRPEARAWIQYRVAETTGAEAAAVDVGAAAHAMLEQFGGTQGERPDAWVLKAAAQELFVAFVEAGGEPEVGNRAYRDSEGKADHPAVEFVGRHLMALFPEVFGDDSRTALRRAHTYLRELNDAGRLPTLRKKGRKEQIS